MNIFLLILSLLAPLMLQASDGETQQGKPNSRKRARNMFSAAMRRPLGSPGSAEFLRTQRERLCTEIEFPNSPIFLTTAGLVAPCFVNIPHAMAVHLSFVPREPRGNNITELRNVNLAKPGGAPLNLKDFVEARFITVFPDGLSLSKRFQTSSLDDNQLRLLEGLPITATFVNTSMRHLPCFDDALGRGIFQAFLREDVSEKDRKINRKSSSVEIVYGGDTPPVSIDDGRYTQPLATELIGRLFPSDHDAQIYRTRQQWLLEQQHSS